MKSARYTCSVYEDTHSYDDTYHYVVEFFKR
jgi:hypothetical protein